MSTPKIVHAAIKACLPISGPAASSIIECALDRLGKRKYTSEEFNQIYDAAHRVQRRTIRRRRKR